MTAGRLNETKARLLSAEDPHPVEVLNPDSDFPILLICEHAGQAVPERLDGLGISQHDLDAHVGWDIGAGSVARHMAELLGAPVVLQRYSRLVIDCNRPPDSPGAIPVRAEILDVDKKQGRLGRYDGKLARQRHVSCP